MGIIIVPTYLAEELHRLKKFIYIKCLDSNNNNMPGPIISTYLFIFARRKMVGEGNDNTARTECTASRLLDFIH